MLKLADRVKETSITVGSGLQIALAGAFGAFQTFASTIGDGNSTYYTIENNSNFEVGVGTYNAGNNTLSRDLVLSSTNNNQRISLDGVSIIFCCYPASQAVLLDNGRINSPSPNYSGIVFPSSTVIDTTLLSGIVSTSILPTSVVYSSDNRLSNNRNPNPHTHPISDIAALQSALDSKQPTGSYAPVAHSHVISDVENLQATLDNKQAAGSYAASSHTHTSSQITDFATAVSSVAPPTTNANLLTAGTLSDDRLSNNIVRTSDSRLSDARTPLNHSHSVSDVTNLQSSLDSKQASGNYALSNHQHIITDVSGLQSALSNKQASGNYATSIHSHLASDITDFASAVITYAPPTVDASLLTTGVLSDSRLSNNIVRTTDARLSDSRTPLSHNHNISDVSGLQTALDSKQISGSYAALSHTHAISSVSGLQLALDGKQPSGSYAALSHTHTSSNIIDFNSSVSGLISGIYAPLSSPTLTGVPLAPTASSGTNTNQIASTSFVRTEISNLVSSAPSTLDTLNELATALGNDPNFATTITNNLASKAALSGAIFTGSISSPSGVFSQSLKVNGTNVSVSGHTHVINDITNLQTTLDSKQPSGSYANLNHTHLIVDVSGLQASLDSKQPSGNYAASSHTHTSSNITDFNSSVSGLLPIISNSGDNRLLTSTGSTVGINAENNLTFDGSLLSVSGNFVAQTGTINSLNFNNIGDPAIAIQQLTWNNSEGSLQLGLSNNYAMFIGEELHYRVRNNTGSTLLAGTPVYATGLTPGGNNRIEIAPKAADGSIREVRFMGLMTEDCNSGFNGYTTHFGYIRGLDTRGNASANGTTNKLWTSGEPSWTEGDILYVHPTVAGKLTKIQPKHSISVAIILNRHQNQGKLFVRPTSYGHLSDNHDVDASGATNGQFLQYNSSTDYWLPSSSGNFTSLQVNGTEVSVSGHSHISSNITDFNSSVSGLLSVKNITASSYIDIVSTTGNYTISVTGLQPSGNYAASSHTHNSSQITDFATSVSGLISGIYAPINSPTFTGTINGTDLQINRITSNEQIAVQSTGVTQFGSKISKPSINISNIGNSSFAIDSNIIGVQIVTNSNIDQSTFQYSRAFYGENKHLIASGVANSGNSVAMQFAGMRNYSSSGDAGYLNALYGIAIQYGHNILDSGATPQTNNIYGLYIEPYNGYGTINNSYDIFARPNAYIIEDYGVINNAYGIYIQGSHKKHLLEGKLGIGTNNPSYQLDVIGNGNFSQNLLVNGTPVSVSGHIHTSSNITDFSSSVSGILPVKNIVAGSNITVSSISGIYTINSTASGVGSGSCSTTVRGNIIATGTLSSFNIVGGYTSGYLDLFQNGVKLLSGSDFTATDGTSVTLSNSVPSGTVLEYTSLAASVSSSSYTKLDNISSSFNGSSTSFELAVSGTPYYPVSANTLGIYVGGVAQEPIVSYSVSGSNIVFTEAPASGLTFWGVGYGTTAVATLNGIVPGSSGSPAISSSNDLTTGFYFPSSGNISVAGNLGIGTSSPSTLLDINNDKFRVRNSKTPSSPNDIGNQGDICWDSNYIYVCTSTNSWTRTPISVWSSDQYFSNVSLLLHMDGTGNIFTDSSLPTKSVAVSYGSPTQSTTKSKFGGKALYLDGSSSIVTQASSAFDFGAGDFTIEFWVLFNSVASGQRIAGGDQQLGGSYNWAIYTTVTGRLDFYLSTGTPWDIASGQPFGSIETDRWYHVALVRNGNTFTGYLDGVAGASVTSSSALASNSNNGPHFGFATGGYFNGYIDDVRITKGVARTITVPTASFPNYNT